MITVNVSSTGKFLSYSGLSDQSTQIQGTSVEIRTTLY